MECAGLTEGLEATLSQIPKDQLGRILKNVVILGGNSNVPGFDQRIKKELRMMTPSDLQINIQSNIKDRELQPWLGAKKLVNLWQQEGNSMSTYTLTKQDYEECGTHYLKEHMLSNRLYGKNHKY
jgi:actin-related protein 6